MLTIPGWKGAVQSEVEHKSVDFKDRILYIIEHLPRDWDGQVLYSNSKKLLEVHEVSGVEMGASMAALPEGESAWRFDALSLAVLDEATKIRDISEAYTAADSCIDTTQGGKLLVIFTSVPGTWPNREVEAMLERGIDLGEVA